MKTPKIIKLSGVHKQLIWGTEDWIVSGHPNGQSEIVNKQFRGISLKQLFFAHPQFFNGRKYEQFPLLVKIIDAKADLSIQVHPNDQYAKEKENALGKTECWYVLDCLENADIIIGLNSKSKKEIEAAIDNNQIEKYLNIQKIKPGDFMYIPAGTVHAIRANTKILEIQQSSDITYRLYDYNRYDKNNNLRELHIEKSKDVIDVEQVPQIISTNDQTQKLIDEKYFSVEIHNGKLDQTLDNPHDFLIGILLEGKLIANEQKINPLEAFIIPFGKQLELQLDGKLMLTHPNSSSAN